MTDLPPIDDELLSAYLDDEVTAAERAAIEGDARSMARLGELRAVREAVSAPVSRLTDQQRDDLVAAALAASTTVPAVTSLTRARAERSFNWRPLAAVAAAIAVIGLAIPVIRNADLGDDSSDTATEAATADEPADEPASEEAAEFSTADSAGDGDEAGAAIAAAPAADDSVEEPADEPAEAAADAGDFDTSGEAEGFEPLPAHLGEFSDITATIERVFADYAGWLVEPGLFTERNLLPEEPPVGPCVVELDLEELVADHRFDHAEATVAGVEHVVHLFDDGRVLIAPVDACDPVTESFFEG